MDFTLTSEQRDIKDLAQNFAQNEIAPKAAKYDEEETFPRDIAQKAHEVGLLNTCIPQDAGGLGLSALSSVLISEEMAYGCMGVNTTLMANDLALLPIVVAGNEQQKKAHLSRFAEEFALASFCLTEPNTGSDAASISTSLKKVGKDYELSGQKMWITNAGEADLFVVYATIDSKLKHKGITCVVVDPKSNGIELGKKEPKMGHRSSDTRSVSFNKVKVSAEQIIGGAGEGWKVAMKTLDHSRPLVAASAVGGARRAMDWALSYAQERKQFGRLLGEHQMVQQIIADMAIGIESSRLLTYKAASLLDQGQRNTYVASMAKAMAADTCMKVATEAVQIYGGLGYSREYPVEKIMRDAKLIQIYEGTSQIQRLVIAREAMARTDKSSLSG